MYDIDSTNVTLYSLKWQEKFLSEESDFQVSNHIRMLPCRNNCRFDWNCAKKYVEGDCVTKIDSFVANEVHGKPGEKTFKSNEIEFKTTNPPGKVV